MDEEQTFNERQRKGAQGTGTVQIEPTPAKLQAAIHPVRPLFTLFGRLSWQRRKEEREKEKEGPTRKSAKSHR